MAETVPGVVVDAWFIIVAPAGTPSDIVQRLNHEISDYLKSSPEIGARFAKVGLGISSAGIPEGLTQFIRSEQEKWRDWRKSSTSKRNSAELVGVMGPVPRSCLCGTISSVRGVVR